MGGVTPSRGAEGVAANSKWKKEIVLNRHYDLPRTNASCTSKKQAVTLPNSLCILALRMNSSACFSIFSSA